MRFRVVAFTLVAGVVAASCGHSAATKAPPAATPAPAPPSREAEFWTPDTTAPAPVAARPAPSAEPPMPPAAEGPRFAVRGVDSNDVLYVRSAPGPKNPVVGQIPPDAGGIVATGARKKVGGGEWFEISYGRTHGWVNARFLIEDRR